VGGYLVLGNTLAHALFMDFLHLWFRHTVFGLFWHTDWHGGGFNH